MASPVAVVDTSHDDIIHDSQFDYYAKRLATCSSDKTIRIFDVTGDVYHPSATITGHQGPVWQLAWAHPKFGVLLASCSYDGSVLIHREAPQNVWTKIFEHKMHESSVNSVCWAPHEFGLILACASSDGTVSILEHKQDQWTCTPIVNDSVGCNAVSWAPYGAATTPVDNKSGSTGPVHMMRLVTGSCDATVRMWQCEAGSTSWTKEKPAQDSSPHNDWIRDVAWCPNMAMPYQLIASCSEDHQVVIWKKQEPSSNSAGTAWEASVMHTFDAPVWRLSWSVTGNVLAVSSGDHKVTLWKQCPDESWVQISSEDAIAE